jgi:hypothetical protein
MLVASPDNRSRMEINERIHTELQGRRFCQRRGVPDPDAGTASVLSGADRTWAERYEVGDVLRYSRVEGNTLWQGRVRAREEH